MKDCRSTAGATTSITLIPDRELYVAALRRKWNINSVVGSMFSTSGRRPQENLYLLNGVEYTSASEINNTPVE